VQVVSPPTPRELIFEPDAEADEEARKKKDATDTSLDDKARQERHEAHTKATALSASARKLLQQHAAEQGGGGRSAAAEPLSVKSFGGVCTLSDLRVALGPHDAKHGGKGSGRSGESKGDAGGGDGGGALTGRFELSGVPGVQTVELQLLTSVDGAEPRPSRTAVLFSKVDHDACARLLADDADNAASASADGGGGGGGGGAGEAVSLSKPVHVALEDAGGRPFVCCSHLQPAPLQDCEGPVEEGVPVTRGARGNPDSLPARIPVSIRHSVRLMVTAADGKTAASSVDVLVLRSGLSGAPAGTLVNGVPPPPPIPMALWKKVALSLLGLFTMLISLSFMMPVKFEWAVKKLGMEQTAEFLGLIAPKNGAQVGWTRTVLATGTQSVKRFLGSGGRRI
jgi:hypothetical protein